MNRRYELQKILCRVLGSNNVYFQPPASVRMTYPAIVYSLSDIKADFADNVPYKKSKAYEVTLIDKDPDSKFVDAILELPYCKFNRSYKSENLNHFVFLLYY